MGELVIAVGFILFIVFVVTVAVVAWNFGGTKGVAPGPQYHYGRKAAVMTVREAEFYRRLEQTVQGRYYIFPQLHLSAMMYNKTSGRYRRLAFQRINRTSVDYVLCDKETMTPVYAVELDDRTHDSELRRKRDAGVQIMLDSVNIPLVRFRDVERMSDEQIIEAFKAAANR